MGSGEPQFSETYTFYANADDGQLIIDEWHNGATEYAGAIALAAIERSLRAQPAGDMVDSKK